MDGCVWLFKNILAWVTALSFLQPFNTARYSCQSLACWKHVGLSLNAVLHCNFEEMDNILYNKIETSKDYHALSMSKIADNFILNPIKIKVGIEYVTARGVTKT